MKTHGLISPKGLGPKIDLDRVPSTAALLSPKYIKKAFIPAAKVAEAVPKLIDAKVWMIFFVVARFDSGKLLKPFKSWLIRYCVLQQRPELVVSHQRCRRLIRIRICL